MSGQKGHLTTGKARLYWFLHTTSSTPLLQYPDGRVEFFHNAVRRWRKAEWVSYFGGTRRLDEVSTIFFDYVGDL